MKLTAHLHLLLRLRMGGAIPLLPCTPSWRGQGKLDFPMSLNKLFPTGLMFIFMLCIFTKKGGEGKEKRKLIYSSTPIPNCTPFYTTSLNALFRASWSLIIYDNVSHVGAILNYLTTVRAGISCGQVKSSSSSCLICIDTHNPTWMCIRPNFSCTFL